MSSSARGRAAVPALAVQSLVLSDFPQPALARTLSANGRAHWGARLSAREKVAARVGIAVRWFGTQPVWGPVRLTFVWVFPRAGRHDLDNLIGSGVTKSAIDSLVRLGVLVDDSSQYVVSVAAEVRVERGVRALEIRIEPQETDR
jgi:Holliday junction resolvase RusA-like endonuclease